MSVEDHTSSCWHYLCTKGHLKSDVVVVGILVLFFVAGVVGFGTGFEASSEAWGDCAMYRVSHPSLCYRILHVAIGQAKGFNSSSIALLLNLFYAIWI